jgi:general secretion pathway protein H
MRISAVGSEAVAERLPPTLTRRASQAGFSLLELVLVLAIIAIATAGVSLSLPDSSRKTLTREAQRLAALFESARAQSRASGIAVRWQTTSEGFRFDGLAADALPRSWLGTGIVVRGDSRVLLGPEPIIGAQAVEIVDSTQPGYALRVTSDGLRPFSVQDAAQP